MPILRTELLPGYPIFQVQHPAVTARIALHGAHLMEWTPVGQAAALYLSPQAVYEPGKAIRGGVPVCWPWFGPNTGDPSLPMHGFVRNRFWKPGDFSETETGVRLQFLLTDDAETRRLWPHAFQLELVMELGASLHMALKMTNSGEVPFTITGALHTYLWIGDIHQATVTGLDGISYLDTVGTPSQQVQAGDIDFDREVDRIYTTSHSITIVDAGLARNITISGSGSGSAVVWNPWIEKSKILADLPDGDYHRFICVETTNARWDSITLAAGESHVLATEIKITVPS